MYVSIKCNVNEDTINDIIKDLLEDYNISSYINNQFCYYHINTNKNNYCDITGFLDELLPVIRYMIEITNDNLSMSRIHINKKNKKIITDNAKKRIAL